MGYLPIILALLGFIFLWGIVNLNSIKSKRKEAEAAARLVFQYAAFRNTLLRQMQQAVPQEDVFHPILAKIQPLLNEQTKEELSTQQKIELESKVTEQITHLPAPENEPLIYQQLQKANNNYRQAVTLYTVRLKEYNELVTRYPSKIVARMMGMQKIEGEDS